MKPTRANGIKAMMQRKLHPPLSLDRRQSQRLVGLISSSFRQKLDEEHPQTSADQRPIDRHLGSILANPLFQQPEVSSAHGSEQDPLDLFKQQVADGTVTVDKAHLMLAKKKLHAQPWSEEVALDAQRCVTAVVNWLWASGLEDSMTLNPNWTFHRVLLSYLALANRHDVLWRWQRKFAAEHEASTSKMDVLENPSQLSSNTYIKLMTLHVSRFSAQRYKAAATSDDCAREFLKIADCPIAQADVKRRVVRIASHSLANALLARPDAKLLSAELYDMITTNALVKSVMSRQKVTALALFAPNPDVNSAYAFLKQDLGWLMAKDVKRTLRDLTLISIRTIDLLLDQGRRDEAIQIATMMKKYQGGARLSQHTHDTSNSAEISAADSWEDSLFRRSGAIIASFD